MLSLVSNSNQLLNPAQTDVLPCEYLSLDIMERWIILGYMLIPQTLLKPQALDCWTQALQTGWAITLFRWEAGICLDNYILYREYVENSLKWIS